MTTMWPNLSLSLSTVLSEWERGGIISSLLGILHNPGDTPVNVLGKWKPSVLQQKTSWEPGSEHSDRIMNANWTLTMRSDVHRKKENWQRHFKINNQTMKNLNHYLVNNFKLQTHQTFSTSINWQQYRWVGLQVIPHFWDPLKRNKGRNKMPKH